MSGNIRGKIDYSAVMEDPYEVKNQSLPKQDSQYLIPGD